MIKNKRSKENPMIFKTKENKVRHNLREKILRRTWEMSLLFLQIPAQNINMKVLSFGSADLRLLWASHDLVFIKI
jgi:hypothetical protein